MTLLPTSRARCHGGRRRFSLPRSWIPLLLAGAAACHSSTGPTAATTGTLIITLPEPAGTTAQAVVAGPTGSGIADFVPPDTLTLLPVGTYTMSDATATATDPIVTPFYVGTITGSPVTLSEADTAYMSVTFTVVSGSGRAWIGSTNGGSTISSGFTSTELTTGVAPSTSLSVTGAYDAFDAVSNLWVADSVGNTLSEYPATSMGASGTPARTVTVTSSALSGPIGLVFDKSGDLWVSNAGTSTVVEFSASQLTAGGSVTPVVTLSGAALDVPGRIAFDAYGDLWVPNQGSNTVVEFAASQLGATGAPTPAVTLSATASSIAGPRAVEFDEQGNLWVANGTGNTIVSFANAQQTASGSPTPSEVLSIPSAYAGPFAFAFDNSGDLWALGTAGPNVIEYTAQQIAVGAASQPGYVIRVPSTPVSLAFDPPPNGIPLVGPLTERHLRGPKSTDAASRAVRGR
jgi:hypothetical protein